MPRFRLLTRTLCAAAVAVALVSGDAAARPSKPKHRTASSVSAKRAKAAKAKIARGTRTKATGGRATSRRRLTVARRAPIGRASGATVQRLAAASLPAIPQVALPDLAGVLGGEVLALPAPAAAPTFAAAPAGDRPRPFAAFSASASGLLDRVTSRARGQLGTRYVLGGERPGAALDCSSFARYVMAAVGLRLPRTAQQQAQVGRAVPRDRAALRPGDLLTFGTRRHVDHVGIYLGQGRFIHASVSSGRVIETTIERNGSLFRKWTGARRLIAGADSMRDDG